MGEPVGSVPLPLARDHRRAFERNRYVYAVVSRRSKGVSLGVNLNPDKVCNFDCVYCQVDRTTPGAGKEVDPVALGKELADLLDRVLSGELFEHERFRATPARLRRLNDIAFSGDGEPTTCPSFGDVVRIAAELKREPGLDAVKLVLITNATMLHRPAVQAALEVMDANNGEVWAKLDAGTAEYYQRVERTTIPLAHVLENITLTARKRSVVIQSMFLKMHGEPPAADEIAAYCQRLDEIRGAGGRISLVQVYTVARTPPEPWVTPLSPAEVEALAAHVRARTGLPAEAYG